MSRPCDQALEEHHAAAEGAHRLVTGAFERVGQLVVGGDHAYAASSAAGRGLEHQRVADLFRGGLGGIDVVDRSATPWGDRHADLLGQQFRADLVAQTTHGTSARADEGDADPVAHLGEVRVLGDETPADPRGIRAGLSQRPFEDCEVEVRAVHGRAEGVRRVRRAHEHR